MVSVLLCRPDMKLPHAHPTSWCPGARLLGIRDMGQLQDSFNQRLQCGCGAKGLGKFWCFSFGPRKMLGARNVDAIEKEMERI